MGSTGRASGRPGAAGVCGGGWMGGLILTASLLLVSGAGPLAPRGAGAAPKEGPGVASIRKLLDGGDAEKALSTCYAALEHDAASVDLLALGSEAAEKAGRADEALWLAQLALRAAREAASPAPLQRALEARVRTLDPLPEAERAPLDDYARQLFDLAQACTKRKLYANAVDFYERCAATPLAAAATEQLEKLYGNAKAVDALLASGIDVPLRLRRARAAARLAKEDAKYATWENARKLKGENYTVVTNAGYELGAAVLDAMEQANRFYRVVFQHKQRGGATARCTIRLYATRAEFEEYEGVQDPNLVGFYSLKNYVACYDPRSVGGPLAGLWETLFHEAAHQFTNMISTGRIPGWLDEGTATYFEGTRRSANGRVESNLIHEGRLKHLKDVLDQGSPTLKQVVSHPGGGDFPGDCYPMSGYLVYFFKNYEDEECRRVYAPHFDAYLRSYRTGEQHDVFARFVEYFVTQPAQPGVTTFEQFEERFRRWCLDLHALHFGPPERADDLVARGDRQRAAGQVEAAMESYRRALAKRDGHVRALLALAELHAERKEDDASAYRYRQVVDLARRAEDPAAPLATAGDLSATALLERCLGAIAAADKALGAAVAEADGRFAEQARAAASRYAEAGHPRSAAWLLDVARTAVVGFPALETDLEALEARHGVQASLWQRLPLTRDAWAGRPQWRVEADGFAIRKEGGGATALLLREPMPDRYRLEATVHCKAVAGEDPFVGLLFGIDDGGVWDGIFVSGKGSVDVSRCADEWTEFQKLPPLDDAVREPFTLGVEVRRDSVKFFLEGKHVYTRSYPPSELRGRIGLLAQDADVSFTGLRVAH